MPDNDEKARKRVFAAITEAIKIIKSNSEQLYAHLVQSIKTGEFCVYKPDVAIEWI